MIKKSKLMIYRILSLVLIVIIIILSVKIIKNNNSQSGMNDSVYSESTLEVTDCFGMTAKEAAKYLHFGERLEVFEYVYLYGNQGVSYLGTDKKTYNENSEDWWDLNIYDKNISFYGIKVGSAKEDAEMTLSKNGWSFEDKQIDRENPVLEEYCYESNNYEGEFKKIYISYDVTGTIRKIAYVVVLGGE